MTAAQALAYMAAQSGAVTPPRRNASSQPLTGDIFVMKRPEQSTTFLDKPYYMYLGTDKADNNIDMFMNLNAHIMNEHTKPIKINLSTLTKLLNPIDSVQASYRGAVTPFDISRIGASKFVYEDRAKFNVNNVNFTKLAKHILLIINEYILLSTSPIQVTQHRAPYLCNILHYVAGTSAFRQEQCISQGASMTRRNRRSSRRSSRRSNRRN